MGESTTLSVMNALLKVQQEKLLDQFAKQTPARTEIKPQLRTRVGGGRSVERPMRTQANMSFAGVLGAQGSMATSGSGAYSSAILPTFPHNGRCAFGHIDEIKARSQVQSVEKLVDRATKDLIDGFALQMNMRWWEDGRGVVARVNGAPNIGTMTITFDAPMAAAGGKTAGVQHLAVGATYMATSDPNATMPDRTSKFTVVSIDTAANTAVVTGNIADLVDNDYVCVEDGLNNVTDGLLSVSSRYKTTYLNINRTTFPWFDCINKTYVDTTSKESTIIGLLMQAAQERGHSPSMGFTHYEVVQAIWEESVSGNRRFVQQGNSFNRRHALGFEAVGVASPSGSITEIFIDHHVPGQYTSSTGQMLLIDPADWSVDQPETAGWYKPDGSMIRVQEGTFGLYATWLEVSSLVCDMPKRQILIDTLKAKV